MAEKYPQTDAGWFETKASHQELMAFKSDVDAKIKELFEQLRAQSKWRMDTNQVVQQIDRTLDHLQIRVNEIEDMIDSESEWYVPEDHDEGDVITDSSDDSSSSSNSSSGTSSSSDSSSGTSSSSDSSSGTSSSSNSSSESSSDSDRDIDAYYRQRRDSDV
jgi:hypothetical protein